MRSAANLAWACIAALTAAGGAGLWLAETRAQQSHAETLASHATGGDAQRASAAIVHYGCSGCHQIPGIASPSGHVGPDLTTLAQRVYVGGSLRNGGETIVRMIVNPRSVNPRSAMPATGITEAEARDVAAYLLAQR
ncbi:MAG: hypothetical protein JWM36_3352 [Hyphomicrobiales bacterium]|nr:hypothetical protein [Hyphomicrobiales bacterium]